VRRNVFETGLWIKVVDGGAGCHIFLDNYSLLPPAAAAPKIKTLETERKIDPIVPKRRPEKR
jgi:hypothetical protein